MPTPPETSFATLKTDSTAKSLPIFSKLETTMGKLRNRCKGQTKAGKPCRAAATEGGFCYFHADPDRAAELGRLGGRSHRRGIAEGVDPLPRLDSAKAVQETLDRLVPDVYSGRLPPRVASSLATLLSLQLRAIETTGIERRLAEVEKQLAEANGRSVTSEVPEA